MVSRKNPTAVRSMIALATLFAAARGVPTARAAEDTTRPQPPESQPMSAKDKLDLAADLLTQGRVVKARNLVLPLTTGKGGIGLSNAERERATLIAANASNRLRKLSQTEVSLQTAEDAFDQADLRTATAHATGVVSAPKATNEQVSAARALLARIDAKKQEVAAGVPAKLQAGVAALDSGDASGARAALEEVVRSGVELSEADQSLLDRSQARLVGAMGHAEAFQPGVVRRQPQTPPPSDPQPVEEVPVVFEQPEQLPVFPENTQPQTQPAEFQTQPIVVYEAAPAPQGGVDPVAMARNWEAQSLLAEGDYAFSENRMADAADRYGRLLSEFADQLSPDQTSYVQSRLAETRVRMGVNPGQSRDVLQEAVNSAQIARQEAEAEFGNLLAQAQAALQRGDTQRARDLATQAKVRINGARNFFSNEEVDSRVSQADGVLTDIDRREGEIRAANIQRQADENAAAAAESLKRQSTEKSRQLNESIDRVRALQAESKYEEALQVVESNILFRDPTNPTGLLLRDVLADAILFRQVTDVNRARFRTYAEQHLANEEAMMAPDSIMTYPSDWPALSGRRGEPIAFAEAEENRRALATIQTKRIPVNFNDTPLENVVAFIQAVTSLNIDTDWQSLEANGINKTTPITLNLTNVPVETVLNRVTEKASPDPITGASWTINDGVLTIASKEQINRQKVMVIYDIRDLIVEVPDYPEAARINIQQALQARGRGGGGGGQNPFTANEQEAPERRTIQERSQEVIDILTTNVDRDGWRENGGDVGYIQQLNGLLIVTNTPSNHRSINGLLSKLREYRAMQINVETRFLLVTQDFFEQIGFDLDVYLNANSNTVRAARATRPTTRANDFFDFRQGGFRDTFPQQPSAGANTNRTPLASPWSPIGAGQDSLGLSEQLLSSDFADEVFTSAPALGIGGQFLDDIQVDFLIKATQADRRNVSLTAPRLTFTNGQISNIFVGNQIQYISDLQPVVQDSAVGFDPDTDVITDGVSLLIDGTISADRRYVTINISTGISKLEGFERLPVTAVAGGQLVNSSDTQSFIQLPTTSVTQVQTTVTVPDQGTILLGGQRLTTDAEVETGVPVLSKVPILNRFFTNRLMTKEESTLLILLKPTILIQNEEEDRNFPGIEGTLRIPGG